MTNHNVLITGSSRGIGLDLVRGFTELGYTVINTHCGTPQPDSNYLDLSDPESISGLSRYVLKRYEHIDILVNNGGISQRKDFMALTVDDLNQMWNTNLRGMMLLTQALLPSMLARRYGKIINIASTAGINGGTEQIHYAVCKAGIINFTKSIAKVYASQGIRCNCVSPGIIDTEMIPAEFRNERLTKSIPCGIMGTPADVTNAVTWLANDASNYISGENIVVSGGRIQ